MCTASPLTSARTRSWIGATSKKPPVGEIRLASGLAYRRAIVSRYSWVNDFTSDLADVRGPHQRELLEKTCSCSSSPASSIEPPCTEWSL